MLTGLFGVKMLGLQPHWANPLVFIAAIYFTEVRRALRLVSAGALAFAAKVGR